MGTSHRGELGAALGVKGAAMAEVAAQWKELVCSDRPGGEIRYIGEGLEARRRPSLRACVHARDSTVGGRGAVRAGSVVAAVRAADKWQQGSEKRAQGFSQFQRVFKSQKIQRI
jgi:hypothetical protein